SAREAAGTIGRQRKRRTGARLLPTEKPLFYPDRINAPHMDCKSRMKRELQVRFWEGAGVRVPRATRLVRSIKEECLNRLIPFGERHFRRRTVPLLGRLGSARPDRACLTSAPYNRALNLWRSPPERDSVRMKSSRLSAPVEWAKCIAHGIRSCDAMSR